MRRYFLLLATVIGMVSVTQAQTIINMPFEQNPEFTTSAESVFTSISETGMTLGADLVIAGGSGTYTYEWSQEGNVLGNESTLYITQPGVYVLRIEDTCDCEKYVTFNVTSASLNNVKSGDFVVYPNPCRGQLYVRQAADNQLMQLSVVSSTGQMVRLFAEPVVENGVVALDLSTLPVGEYILNCVSQDKKVDNIKVVIIK